ncbi:MAG TPA: cyclic nucleotide-binding domain-containing protein [Myxococcota bacterium]|nr:cyclic nucleotide-binding domain-containing protein [Myxococcota bacterium]
MDLVWRLVPSVRPRERGRVAFFLGLGAAVALAQTLGLTAAEGLLLSRLGAARLPSTYVLASLATMVASLLYAYRVGRARNDRVLIELLLLAVAVLLALAVGAEVELAWAPVGLLCLQVAAQAVLGSHYWELTNDYFDRLSAKRLRGVLTAGLSLGAALGGGVAYVAIGGLPAPSLIVGWALMLAGVAALLRFARPQLRRWAPLDLEEDAGSLAGVRSAARWLVASRFGVALLGTAVVMVAAGYVARYLSSETLAREFPTERSLTRFLALYFALTNLAEVAIPLWLAPRLIERFGVPVVSWVQPFLTVVTSGGLLASPHLPAALASRASGELFENALAAPVRSLIGEAVPLRFRARAQAFLEGVVVYAALAGAGALLLVFRNVDRAALALLGVGFALLYLGLHLLLGRRYVEALVAELRAGRLDLRSVGRELGRREVGHLAEVWRSSLRESQTAEEAIALRPLLPLAPFLVQRGLAQEVRAGLDHPSPLVRATCVSALCGDGSADPAELRDVLVRALDDRSTDVRLAALRAISDERSLPAAVAGRVFGRLQDPDPVVRAAAAALAGELGQAVLRRGARSSEASEAVAALDALPTQLAEEAAARLDDADPKVRAAALRFAARHPAALAVDAGRLARELGQRDARVRRAAVEALAAGVGPAAAPLLATHLGDADPAVRRAVVSTLGGLGEPALEAIAGVLAGEPGTAAREAAYDALAALGTPAARAALLLALRARVLEAWNGALGVDALPEDGTPAERFLRVAESDAQRCAVHECFAILALLEDPAVVRTVERTLLHGPERLRLGALEVLSHLGDRESAARLVLLLEPAPLDQKRRDLARFLVPPRSREDVLERARRGAAPWLQLAARRLAGDLHDPEKERLMERLIFLRRIPLFRELGLDQLEAIERIAREEEYVEGEEVVREGDPGEQLYLVIEGELAVWRDRHGTSPIRLNTLGPGSYFGDIAILDRAPRSASVVVTRPSRLLVLDGSLFRELILDRPELAFEVCRALSERLRAAEQRIAG